jgi:hypothetical protein
MYCYHESNYEFYIYTLLTVMYDIYIYMCYAGKLNPAWQYAKHIVLQEKLPVTFKLDCSSLRSDICHFVWSVT